MESSGADICMSRSSSVLSVNSRRNPEMRHPLSICFLYAGSLVNDFFNQYHNDLKGPNEILLNGEMHTLNVNERFIV